MGIYASLVVGQDVARGGGCDVVGVVDELEVALVETLVCGALEGEMASHVVVSHVVAGALVSPRGLVVWERAQGGGDVVK